MNNSSTSIRLLVSSGNGPNECKLAVRHVLKKISGEADERGLNYEIVSDNVSGQSVDKEKLPASSVVLLYGEEAKSLADRWLGTIQWIAQSPLRPGHRRQNWYVGVFKIDHEPDWPNEIDQNDVRFETFRAGGPGGQHQNTTDSAVRVTHTPSGLSAVARDQRSQHRNKQVALQRLSEQLAVQHSLFQAGARKTENLKHHQLERGNPVRCFKGGKFTEKQ
ncbi:peptide chain release factor H [Kiloniella laminariae]|uniref:Peptide chain release factor H n=1 Tax=Kiloniella laminariae TaxID=454162 RepID=A0ABT4LE68_9PROT|nr:peptide chain release factor H [Kiloniella laminariae]MCZ4279384.1 peptide chain release factor H [Kiloniella laminariae]